MKLRDLTSELRKAEIYGAGDPDIGAIIYDSRLVKPGSLFMAVQGFAVDGNLFVSDAVSKGAVAVLTDKPGLTAPVPVVQVNDARRAMAIIADRFYGSPQKSLIMTGITGTNGKTTTSYMVRAIFEAGLLDCGLIGTIKHIVSGREVTALNTTPEAPDIHAMLAEMAANGQTACVMEVSSHALALTRVAGIEFRAAAFTNLTRDHLDFHHTFEEYLDAKSRLFVNLAGDATAVVNRDDPYADHIIRAAQPSAVMTYGFEDGDIRVVECSLAPDKTDIVLETPAGLIETCLNIPGRYNVANAMAAAGVAVSCGLPCDVVSRGLAELNTVPGRFETVNEGQDFTVVVDYAHAPDALERILTSVREVTRGRLISVFGCGGDRDRGKRPLMGEISARLADVSIVTSDNPRTEDPRAIIDDILAGVPDTADYVVIPDRKQAIKKAIEMSETDDSVVIAGKGHEDYQIIGKEKRHFDDAETARRFIREQA